MFAGNKLWLVPLWNTRWMMGDEIQAACIYDKRWRQKKASVLSIQTKNKKKTTQNESECVWEFRFLQPPFEWHANEVLIALAQMCHGRCTWISCVFDTTSVNWLFSEKGNFANNHITHRHTCRCGNKTIYVCSVTEMREKKTQEEKDTKANTQKNQLKSRLYIAN